MRSNKYLLCLSLVAAFVFVFIQAQPSKAQIRGLPKLYEEFKMPETGTYVTYKVTYAKNNVERMITLSFLGKEKSEKEEDLYWFEQKEADPKTGNVSIMKMLMSGNPQKPGTIHRMIVKSGKEKASELSQAIVQMINQTPAQKTEAEKPKIKNLGTEKMKLKDEALTCVHFQYISKDKTTEDVWTNDKMPFFSLAKSITPEATWELSEYGTGAVSAIKEKPEVLEIPEQK
jgi:hypothetical protein